MGLALQRIEHDHGVVIPTGYKRASVGREDKIVGVISGFQHTRSGKVLRIQDEQTAQRPLRHIERGAIRRETEAIRTRSLSESLSGLDLAVRKVQRIDGIGGDVGRVERRAVRRERQSGDIRLPFLLFLGGILGKVRQFNVPRGPDDDSTPGKNGGSTRRASLHFPSIPH